MTAQINDTYLFEGKEYQAVAMTDENIFDPKKYGFEPCMMHTACYRGYYCTYEIREDGIYLTDMTIQSEKHPDLFGTKGEPEEFSYNHWKNDLRPEFKDVPYQGPYIYENINHRIDYTGKMVMGADFLDRYYIHMGYQRAWAFRELREFEFEHGRLANTSDHSDYARKLRQKIDESPDGFEKYPDGNIMRFIDESFSRETSVKAWWLDEE